MEECQIKKHIEENKRLQAIIDVMEKQLNETKTHVAT